MNRLNRNDFPGRQPTDRIIQFGEGNFLRAFIDWQIDVLNEQHDLDAGIVVVRPRNRAGERTLNEQDGLYTTLIRGLDERGEVVNTSRLIRSVKREIQPFTQYAAFIALAQDPNMRFVFSNTTEAGIAFAEQDTLADRPASSFPGKLTQLLWARFQHFAGDAARGWIVLPCELIDDNGTTLRELVLRYATQWQLPEAFSAWVREHNIFCNTLVDRIVTGYPQDAATLEQQLGYQDRYLVAGEVYYQFVIQGPQQVADELKLAHLAPSVRLVSDIKPWKEQKVAILNGAHTALVPVAFLAGLDHVGEAMADAEIAGFVDRTLREEIIPTLNLPENELHAFADAVQRRFRNPFIQHALLAIALNGMTKFRTRLLPQLLASHQQHGIWPVRLTFALAALIAFYRGQRNSEHYPLQDDEIWLTRFAQWWPEYGDDLPALVAQVLSQSAHWGSDLSQMPGLTEAVSEHLQAIVTQGMRAAVAQLR